MFNISLHGFIVLITIAWLVESQVAWIEACCVAELAGIATIAELAIDMLVAAKAALLRSKASLMFLAVWVVMSIAE